MPNFYISWPVTPSAEWLFTLDFPQNEILKFDMATITYTTLDKSFPVYNDYIGQAIESLIAQLTAALYGDLELDPLIKNKNTIPNLGYGSQLCLYQFYNDNLPLDAKNNHWFTEGKKLNGYNYASDGLNWIGSKYSLWNYDQKFTSSWLYTKNDKIIFEISPQFRWNKFASCSLKSQKSFDAFMKNYQPLIVTEISRETAQTLLKKATDWNAQFKIIWPNIGLRR